MSCWRDDHHNWCGVAALGASAAVHTLTSTDLMATLLQEFDDVFSVSTGLPPPRRHNHRIHLLPIMVPIAVRPYRYPQLVKDELERQCREMLQQGIIHPSTSAFSSSILLVKKSDDLWWFYVDYCTLNAKTAHDMFPIPVVDELLNELRGAYFFTKVDIRRRYHQVLMELTDVEKTTFQMHHDHFEFLVMLFGLTNAPTTFQALLNDILQEFIRVFILVFFDDILILAIHGAHTCSTFAWSCVAYGSIGWW
jgi:hypothetical protein